MKGARGRPSRRSAHGVAEPSRVDLFIQARMSSSRYPGKVLAPYAGRPLIQHLLDQTRKVTRANRCVVLTSAEPSDDPLVAYLASRGVECFRGDLTNVFLRFRQAALALGPEWFVRLCADSPLIDGDLINAVVARISQEVQVVTNVFSRTFPRGQSVEAIHVPTFLGVDAELLDEKEREHVMPFFYRHPERFKILSIDSVKDESHLNMCVDTIDDLKSMEKERPVYAFSIQDLCQRRIASGR